mgnify:CR=1 FL=1
MSIWEKKVKDKSLIKDPVLFERYMNAALSSTGQKEFDSTKDEQQEGLFKLHGEMKDKQRALYRATPFWGINDLNKQLVFYTLIRSGHGMSQEERLLENNYLYNILKLLPVHRALKILYELSKAKVNNKSLHLIAQYFINDILTDHICVKYKRLLKVIIKHNHIDYKRKNKPAKGSDEFIPFVLGKKREYTHPLFKDYKRAKNDRDAVFKLPYSVAIGFKNLHNIDDSEFYNKIQGKMSKKEKLKTQNTAQRAGENVSTNFKQYKPIELNKYLRVTSEVETPKQVFEAACKKQSNKIPFRFGKISIVLDNSHSGYSSEEKKNHAVACNESVAHVLKNLAEECKIHSTPDDKDFLAKPIGDTNIATALVEALKDEPEIVFILSDGYENSPAGATDQVIHAYYQKVDKSKKTLVVHINPVFDPKTGDVRKLSEYISTFGIRDEENLFGILLMIIAYHKEDKIEELIIDVENNLIFIKTKKKDLIKLKVKKK